MAWDLDIALQQKLLPMKKAIFTLVLLTSTLIAVAQTGSVLNLSVYGNSVFTVQMDHQFFNQPDRFYSIRAVTPGRHFIRVFKQHFRPQGVRQQEIFSGFVNVPFNSVMDAHVDRYGRLKIRNIQQLYADNPCADPYYMENYTDFDQCNGQNPYVSNCSNANGTCGTTQMPMVMSEADFMALKSMIASKAFDSTRLQIAKQALNMNYMTAAQVDQLLNLFTFDSSRLDLAKSAYTRTIDRQNYFLTYDAFTFDSSVNELIQYINTVS